MTHGAHPGAFRQSAVKGKQNSADGDTEHALLFKSFKLPPWVFLDKLYTALVNFTLCSYSSHDSRVEYVSGFARTAPTAANS